MARDIKVRTAKLSVTTVGLTKSLLKQIRRIDYRDNTDLFGKDGIRKELVVGWIHGSVLGEEHTRFFLVDMGDGDWGLSMCGMSDYKVYKQIYVG